MSTHWQPPPGWYPDPEGLHDWRWWEGTRWADTISDGGVAANDPLDDAVAVAQLPPGPVLAPGEVPRPPALPVRTTASGGEIARTILYLAVLFTGGVLVTAATGSNLWSALLYLAVLAVVAPKVGYRARDCFLVLIPFYGVWFAGKMAYRLACWNRRYWSSNSD